LRYVKQFRFTVAVWRFDARHTHGNSVDFVG
jgi:hypothetical protein